MPQSAPSSSPIDPSALPTPALSSFTLRMSYRIARGEQGVLTFEPYKSLLLPHWRFRTAAIASQSSTTLRKAFDHYVRAGDFVGADMARKFIQMGMTRAKRYANHKGGKKYAEGGEGRGRKQLPKSDGHEGREEKLRASEIFKEVWKACVADEKYGAMKKEFLEELKAWEKRREKEEVKDEEEEEGEEGEEVEDRHVKSEEGEEDRKEVKTEEDEEEKG